jgi:hypothetical protein
MNAALKAHAHDVRRYSGAIGEEPQRDQRIRTAGFPEDGAHKEPRPAEKRQQDRHRAPWMRGRLQQAIHDRHQPPVAPTAPGTSIWWLWRAIRLSDSTRGTINSANTTTGWPGASQPRAPTERSVKVSLYSARPIYRLNLN